MTSAKSTGVAEDVMSWPLLTADVQDSLWSGWQRLRGAACSHLVVVDDTRVAGVLSERDLLRQLTIGLLGPQHRPLREALAPDVACVQLHTPVAAVAALMLARGVDAVPVVTADGTLHGLVTATDLVRVVAGDQAPEGGRP